MNPNEPHVLVIDADERYAEALVSAFSALHCRVSTRPDGETGLRFAESDRPDLVVVAAEHPKITGFIVCNRVKRSPVLKSALVVIVTGSMDPQAVNDHREARTHADAYVPRATEPGTLAADARKLLDARSTESPAPPVAPSAPVRAVDDASALAAKAKLAAEEMRYLEDEIERRQENLDWTALVPLLEQRHARVTDPAEKIRILETLLNVHANETLNGPEAIRTAERIMVVVPDHPGAVAALRRAYTRRKDHDRLAELDAHLERVRRK